jgi:hypothetical protein
MRSLVNRASESATRTSSGQLHDQHKAVRESTRGMAGHVHGDTTGTCRHHGTGTCQHFMTNTRPCAKAGGASQGAAHSHWQAWPRGGHWGALGARGKRLRGKGSVPFPVPLPRLRVVFSDSSPSRGPGWRKEPTPSLSVWEGRGRSEVGRLREEPTASGRPGPCSPDRPGHHESRRFPAGSDGLVP